MFIKETNLIDNSYYSLGFPRLEDLVSRRNIISNINHLLFESDEHEIIFLNGEEESGKTVLCGQFGKQNTEVITVFFNSMSNIDFRIEFLYSNVVCQIKHILGKEEAEIHTDTFIDKEEYNKCIHQLRRSKKKTIVLVIDGLDDQTLERKEFIQELFDEIPFGQQPFKFLISGARKEFLELLPKLKKIKSKELTLNGFSSLEVMNFLSIDNEKYLDEIFSVTRGLPGRLKTLKRNLKEGIEIEEILKSNDYREIIANDCNQLDLEDPKINSILSLLSLSEKQFNIDFLAQVIEINSEEILNVLSPIKIIEINDFVQIVSNSHRNYLSNKLRGNRSKVNELLIRYYSEDESLESIVQLPSLYSDQKDWEKIITLLNEDYLTRILEETGSLKIVNQCLELGIEASKKVSKHKDLWRYSLQGSIVNELDNYLFWESEIDARTSIKDYTGAITLADSAMLKVDRLSLLSLIAKRQKELEGDVDDHLDGLIRDLYSEVDLSAVGSKIYDIVSNLIYAIPNLAIDMIENSTGTGDNENDINDWVLSKLSVSAIDSALKSQDNGEVEKKLEIMAKVNAPNVKKINRAIGFLVGNYSAQKVLLEIKKLSDSSERLRLIRLWLMNNRSSENKIYSVVDAGIDELIKIPEKNSINILKELSHQVPFLDSIDQKKRLFSRFRKIQADLTDLGLIKNKYKYELNMFHIKHTLNENEARHLLLKVLKDTDSLEDSLVKLEVYSEVYSTLKTIGGQSFRKQEGFVYSQVLVLFKGIFANTSQHFKIAKPIITTIGKKNPNLALKAIEMMNIESRRERAKFLLLDSYLNNSIRYINIELLKKIGKTFKNEYSRDEFIETILLRYSEAKSLPRVVIQNLLPFFTEVKEIKNQKDKVLNFVLVVKIINKNDSWKRKLEKTYLERLKNAWEEIDSEWSRIDVGYKICSEVSKFSDPFAKEIFKKSENLKSSSWLDSKIVAYSYFNSLKIVIRSFHGLLISNNETEADRLILEQLISRIPGKNERLKLWSEICFGVYESGKTDIAKKYTEQQIIPIVEELLKSKSDIRNVHSSFILIRLHNPSLADLYEKRMSKTAIQITNMEYAHYVLTKENPFELYDNKNRRFNVFYGEIVSAINCLKKVKEDSEIDYLLGLICDAIKDSKHNLQDVQITTITGLLEEYIESSLPDENNIKHEGYKILAKLQLLLIQRKGVQEKDWLDLVTSSNSISNRPDRLLVRAQLLDGIPKGKIKNPSFHIGLADSILKEMEEVKDSQVHYEFVQRVIDLTDIMYKYEGRRWKELISEAFTFSNNLQDGSEVYGAQKKMIDSIYKLDEGFAKELVSRLENNGKSPRISKLVNDHYKSLEITNKIKKNTSLKDQEKKNHRVLVKGVLDALRSLNSNHTIPKKINDSIKYLTIGNKLPLHEVFPIYMYYLSNCQKVYKDSSTLTGKVKNIHIQNFKEAVKATNLIELLSYKRKSKKSIKREFFIDQKFSSNLSVHPGSRPEALEFIRSWIQDNAEEYLIIVDPFLCKEDLDLLLMIKEINPELMITLLGNKDGWKQSIEGDFHDHWQVVSNDLPPFTDITFCWIPDANNKTPFHDRWIITKNGGLRSGTSFNSLGISKESEISVMDYNEAVNIKESTINEYVGRKKREKNGQRILYKSFTM